MRIVLAAALVMLFAACPSSSGPQGEQGPAGEQGPQGPQGPQGLQGPQGEAGIAGAQGVAGEKGDTGAQGPTGPQGVQGPAGMVLVIDGGVVTGPAGASVVVTPIAPGGATCPNGGLRVTQLSDGGISEVCNGAPGTTGAQGAQGPVGMAGPQGAPGASPTASTLPVMSAQCATGGVLINFPDGGSLPVCNGAQGPVGPTGATGATGAAGATGSAGPTGATGATGATGPAGAIGATGATGAMGPQGVPGASPTASTLPVMSAQCATGGVLINFPDGGALPVCNGAQGPAGATGATGATGAIGATGATGATGPAGAIGATGATGAMGPQGPPGQTGPAGAVLYLDGGVAVISDSTAITFAGYTSATYNGNLGGQIGGNQKCAAEFSGSHLCTIDEFDSTDPTSFPGASGAWIDPARSDLGARPTGSNCQAGQGAWSSTSGSTYGYNLSANGAFYTTVACSNTKPLACCRGGATRVVFRGYTAATFNGNLGGQIGANQKCQAEYSGSFFCSVAEFDITNPTSYPGAAGAWIDPERSSKGARATGSNCQAGLGAWSSTSGSTYGYNLSTNGAFYTTVACSNAKPLACCQRL